MLNLLPKDHIKEVRGEYLRRFYIVALILASVTMVFFIVAIFPSYISTKSKESVAQSVSLSIKESSKAKDRDALSLTVKNLESKIKILETIPGDKPTDYIDKALELKEKGISIQNISYVKKDVNQREVTMEGTAFSRADLINFSKKVKTSGWSTSSDIPISNLASDKDIRFFVTLTATSTPK